VSFTIRFTADDLERFSAASLDRNPLHWSEDYARKTPFGQRVVHGMLGFTACLRGLTLPPGTTPSRVSLDFKSALLLGVDYQLRVVSESSTALKAVLTDGSAVVMRIGLEYRNAAPQLTELPEESTAPCAEPRRIPDDDLGPGLAFHGGYAPSRRRYRELLDHLRIERDRWGDGLLLTCLACSYVTGMELPGETALLWSLTAEILAPRPELPAAFAIAVTHVNRRFAMVRSQLSLGEPSGLFARGEIVATARPSAPRAAAGSRGLRAQRFSGKHAVIVGASRGLGAVLALELAAEGATVVGLYSRSQDDAAELLSASRALPGRLILEHGNAADLDWCRSVKKRIQDELGRLDLLICNAAPAIQPLRVEEACYDRIRAYLDEGVALVGAPLSVFLELIAASHGRAILISSSAVETPPPQWPHYVALKAAAEGLVRGAAAHHASVTFTIVRPGRIRTDFSSNPLGHVGAEDASTVARRILDDAASAALGAENVHVCR
jgi:NAD(P)-dependent dehydrogenase (short-subunit alcohol dehydrogenase family)